MVDKALVGEVVHYPVNEVTTKTVGLTLGLLYVQEELTFTEGTVLHTASSSTTGKIEWIFL